MTHTRHTGRGRTGRASYRTRQGLVALVGCGLLMAATVGCAPPPGPPLPPGLSPAPEGTPATSVAGIVGPDYVESEHFLSSTGSTYEEDGTWTGDGRWGVRVAETSQPFATRLLVARPADPANFSGTVWVEWLNVTGGLDFASSLPFAREAIIESGGTWVGVSAQKAGVDQLRSSDPDRYASLNLPTDALDYDLYTQAAETIRAHPELVNGTPEAVIGVGHSQSAVRLTTYVNAFQNRDDAYDGFVIHSRFSTGAPIGDGLMGDVPTRIRDDIGVPVLQLQSEVEVELNLEAFLPGLGDWENVRQPDAGNVHTWEVAGGGHLDAAALNMPGLDPSFLTGFLGLLCGTQVNAFPTRYAANSGYAALEHWARGGPRPASAPVIVTVDGVVQRDAEGNALGGLRLPDIDVPIARYNRAPSGNPICDLFGAQAPFTPDTLRARYGTPANYLAAYTAKADQAVAAGILLPADRDDAVAAAEQLTF